MDPRRRNMRNVGLGLVIATPLGALVSYALFSVLLGEERFEGTDLGLAVMALPLVLGVGITAWAQFGGPVPSRAVAGWSSSVAGAVFVGVGAWSAIRSPGDASIGGGLLVVAGVASVFVGTRLRRVAQTPSR